MIQNSEFQYGLDIAFEAIIFHKNGIAVKVNKAYSEITGYAESEIIGMNVYELLVHPDDIEIVVNHVREKSQNPYIVRLIKKDSSVVYVEIRGKSYTLDGEEIRISVFRDITSNIEKEKELNRRIKELDRSDKYTKTVISTIQDGFWVVNKAGRIIDVNMSYLQMIGYSREEILQLSINDIDAQESHEETIERMERIKNTGCEIFETKHRCKGGELIDVEVSVSYEDVDGGHFICFSRDVTEKKRFEIEKELTLKLLELLNTRIEIEDLMKEVLDFMFKISGCEAVGIRLHKDDDYPYYETRGFSQQFVKCENYLCSRDIKGQLLRDEFGNPILECMCGNILSARFNPELPFFTNYGSFVSNGTTNLLKNTSEEDRQARTRNRCNGEGYESVMLVPLKTNNEVFGLLQFNDRRENQFSSHFVTLIERMAVDISISLNQKKILKELEVSEKNLKESQKLAKLGSWNLDIKSNQVLWTEELYKMYGFDPNLPPPPFTEHKKLFTKESWEKLSAALEKTINSGIAYDLELETIRIDGTNGWMWVHGEALKDNNGNIVELWGAAQDITERKNTEFQLREKDLEFRKLSKHVPDLIFQFTKRPDGSYYVPIASDGIINIFGCKPEDVKDDFDAIAKVIHPEDAERVINDIEYSAKNLTYFTCEFRVILPEKGEQWIYSRSSPEKLPDGSITWFGFNANITEKKKAEKSLQLAANLESIATLAGGIAHDFNNLLSGIFGNIELAKSKTGDDNIMGYLEKSLESIERARHLTSQLLTFSKGGEPIKKIEKIDTFLKKITEFALSGSNVSCSYKIVENLFPCDVDKNQLGQALDNIIINAKQAMPRGGNIILSAENVFVQEKSNNNLKSGNYVKIQITDTGIGIEKENLQRIFDPFFTTKTMGNGIGLSASYSIINRHNGAIEVESEPGKGSTFTIYLPAVDLKVTENEILENEEHSGSGLFIVMDDELVIRNNLQEILENFGYNVITKRNGLEVIEFIKEEVQAGRSIAGMIFDLTIPGAMGGEEAIIEIRKLIKDTPVFVSSGYSDSPIMADPKKYGFTSSLIKPFRLMDLIHMLNNYVR